MSGRAAFRRVGLVLAALGTVFCINPEAFGCTCSPREYKAGTNFSVQVSDEYGKNVAGVRVAVDRSFEKGTPVGALMSVVSGSNGIATFTGVPIGSHYIEVNEMAEGACAAVVVRVASSGPAPKIELRWPGAHAIETRSASMMMIDSATGAPLIASKAELLKAIGGRRIAAVENATDGRVEFPGVAPGLYVIRISPSNTAAKNQWAPPDGEIPIEIKTQAATVDRLAVGMSSCGIMYGAVSVGPAEHAQDACGDVVDPSGGVIEDAVVKLLQPDGRLTQETRTDKRGRFDFKNVPAGTYRLFVASGGFEPKDIEFNHSGECRKRATISLNVLGF